MARHDRARRLADLGEAQQRDGRKIMRLRDLVKGREGTPFQQEAARGYVGGLANRIGNRNAEIRQVERQADPEPEQPRESWGKRNGLW